MTPEEERRLLSIVRQTLEIYLREQRVPKFEVPEGSLTASKGVFVTLRKGEELRGCIGLIEGRGPLVDSAVEMAIAAATKDPRFSPVRYEELGDLHISVSVLEPPEKVTDIQSIEIGRDGLIMEQGRYRGVLLPQVATEHQWDRETFLEHTAYKAGLRRDAWKKGATVYKFAAHVIEE